MTGLAAALLLLPTLAGPPVAMPEPADVTALPAEVVARLEARVLHGSEAPRRRLELLVEFMFDPAGLALQYDDEVTRTVAETLRAGKGNCLSFTLTFVELAREAGLHAYIQEFDRALVWYRHDDMIFHTSHVNAGVRLLQNEYTVDFDRNIRLTVRNRPKVISAERALAHFYNNRGAELMADGRLQEAGAYFARAGTLDPSYAATWNNLGVLRARSGDEAGAERAYLTALEHDAEHTSALSNIAAMYRAAGDDARADGFERRLDAIRRYDPFHYFVLGTKQEMRGEYAAARDHFRRAIRLHPGDHEFHFALARTYFHLGDTRRAARALTRARELASDRGTADRYRMKLDALRVDARPSRPERPQSMLRCAWPGGVFTC